MEVYGEVSSTLSSEFELEHAVTMLNKKTEAKVLISWLDKEKEGMVNLTGSEIINDYNDTIYVPRKRIFTFINSDNMINIIFK
jgi:hypothetical protein